MFFLSVDMPEGNDGEKKCSRMMLGLFDECSSGNIIFVFSFRHNKYSIHVSHDEFFRQFHSAWASRGCSENNSFEVDLNRKIAGVLKNVGW